MKRRVGERMQGGPPPPPQLPQHLTPQRPGAEGDWLNLIADLLGSLPPTLASAFLPPAFCLGNSGLHSQSTPLIPTFQAVSVLPMGGHPPSPTPSNSWHLRRAQGVRAILGLSQAAAVALQQDLSNF